MSASRSVSTGSASEAPSLPRSLSPSLSELQLLSNGHYHVMVTNTGHGITVDGVAASGPAITMIDDHRAHTVEVRIPRGASASPVAERAA